MRQTNVEEMPPARLTKAASPIVGVAKKEKKLTLRQKMELRDKGVVSMPDQIISVVLPANFQHGEILEVEVPGKGIINVTPPDHIKPGESFKFRVPG